MNNYRVSIELACELEDVIEAESREEAIEEAKEIALLIADWKISVEKIKKHPEEPKEQAEDTTDMIGLFEESEG